MSMRIIALFVISNPTPEGIVEYGHSVKQASFD